MNPTAEAEPDGRSGSKSRRATTGAQLVAAIVTSTGTDQWSVLFLGKDGELQPRRMSGIYRPLGFGAPSNFCTILTYLFILVILRRR
jgi:hypothetical protein